MPASRPPSVPPVRRIVAAATLAALALGTAACSGSSAAGPSPTGATANRPSATAPTSPTGSTSTSGPSTPTPEGPALSVVAAFYPLEFVAERVGGDAVQVTTLTPAGAEPHDLELTPGQVAAIADADLVLYVAGFQPAVEAAIEQQAPDTAINVASGLETLAPPSGSASDGAATDPHVWLDPRNMTAMGERTAQRLADLRPDEAAGFAQRQGELAADMTALDERWAAGTATCSSRDLVVSHEAFGYLAARYGFTQVGIAGISPEAEPSPARIAEISRFVEENGVTTIYFEALVDPQVADTVAAETGAATARLDPLEGLPEGATGDYVSVMDENLATVRTGQGCS